MLIIIVFCGYNIFSGQILHEMLITRQIKYIGLFSTLFLMTMPAFGQFFYLNSYSDTWENDSIYRVESDFSYSNVVTIQGTLSDIAISPSGVMYGIQNSKLYQVNLETGE